MEEPTALFDAAFAHLVKKGVDIKKRKRFMAAFTKAGTDEARLAVVGQWVLVRDVVTFPFQTDKATTGVGGPTPSNVVFDELEDEQDADMGVEGGVSVDDGADGEPESGVTPE